MRLWNVEPLRQLGSFATHPSPIRVFALSPDDQRLALGGTDGTIKIWDIASKRPLATLKGHKGEGIQGEVRAVAFLADGNTLVSVSSHSAAVWRAATLVEIDAKTK